MIHRKRLAHFAPTVLIRAGPVDAYNPRMLETLQSLVTPALMQRLTLFINHVLSSEEVATQRLRPHAGRRFCLEVMDWPRALPAWPNMVFMVTPAGLLEWQQSNDFHPELNTVDLTLTVWATNPAQMALQFLSGKRPRVEVSGDAEFAGDMSWLMDNLRWDVKDDLARWLGPIPAEQLGRLGESIASAVRDLAQRWRSQRAGPSDSAPPSASGSGP